MNLTKENLIKQNSNIHKEEEGKLKNIQDKQLKIKKDIDDAKHQRNLLELTKFINFNIFLPNQITKIHDVDFDINKNRLHKNMSFDRHHKSVVVNSNNNIFSPYSVNENKRVFSTTKKSKELVSAYINTSIDKIGHFTKQNDIIYETNYDDVSKLTSHNSSLLNNHERNVSEENKKRDSNKSLSNKSIEKESLISSKYNNHITK